MHPLTVHALTALHALAHRIELTVAEQQLLDASSPSLVPVVWRQTVQLLRSADAAGEGAFLHLGYEAPIFCWLGLTDEAGCRERHGLSVPDTLAADQGNLAQVARIVDGAREVEADADLDAIVRLVEVWSERAARLAGTGEDMVCAGAFERALAVCPLSAETQGSLWTAFIDACEEHGEDGLAQLARARLPCPPDEDEDAFGACPDAGVAGRRAHRG